MLDLPVPVLKQELIKAWAAHLEKTCPEVVRESKPPHPGVNVFLAEYITKHAAALNTFALNHKTDDLVLLSIVQQAAPTHGYWTCDVVGVVGFGRVERGESKFNAALRETEEESGLRLTSEFLYEIKGVPDEDICEILPCEKGRRLKQSVCVHFRTILDGTLEVVFLSTPPTPPQPRLYTLNRPPLAAAATAALRSSGSDDIDELSSVMMGLAVSQRADTEVVETTSPTPKVVEAADSTPAVNPVAGEIAETPTPPTATHHGANPA